MAWTELRVKGGNTGQGQRSTIAKNESERSRMAGKGWLGRRDPRTFRIETTVRWKGVNDRIEGWQDRRD